MGEGDMRKFGDATLLRPPASRALRLLNELRLDQGLIGHVALFGGDLKIGKIG